MESALERHSRGAQAHFSRVTGVRVSHINDIVHGRANCGKERAFRWAGIVGSGPDIWLCGGDWTRRLPAIEEWHVKEEPGSSGLAPVDFRAFMAALKARVKADTLKDLERRRRIVRLTRAIVAEMNRPEHRLDQAGDYAGILQYLHGVINETSGVG